MERKKNIVTTSSQIKSKMSTNNVTTTLWCVAKNCMKNSFVKRHFFRFPKEHNRWVKWIHACGRYDLKPLGPEYAYCNYRLCHLHFDKKWYKMNKIRPRLDKDAIPTIFHDIEDEWIASEEEITHQAQEENTIETDTEIESTTNVKVEDNISDCEKQSNQEKTNSTSSMYSTTELDIWEKKRRKQCVKIKPDKMRQAPRENVAKYKQEETSCNKTSQTQNSPLIKLYISIGPR